MHSSALLVAAASCIFHGVWGAFSPRVEFPAWRPLGRGDPLTDPTHEYVPPVLERVRYWPTKATPPSLQPQHQPQPPPPPPPLTLVPPPRPPPAALRPPPGVVIVETVQSHTPVSLQSLLLGESEEPSAPPATTAATTLMTTTTTTVPPPTTRESPPAHHYKQPPPPPTGPVYLIIQGHSKVKKYGAGKSDPVSGIYLQQDTNEVTDKRRSGR